MAIRRRLGRTDIELTSIGLGCWQFSGGVGVVGGFWGAIGQEVVDRIVKASLDSGISSAYGPSRRCAVSWRRTSISDQKILLRLASAPMA